MDNDLKWLAKNVHKWLKHDGVKYIALDGDGEICFYGECGEEFNFYPNYAVSYQAGSRKKYTREEWQAVRDELSGKPKEWEGEWLAQNSGGEWTSFDGDQKPNPYHERGYYGTKKGFLKHYGRGRVLGDWRDTLEHRPKQETEPEPKQWRGPEGGLPPVGTECEWRSYKLGCGEWHKVTVVAIHEGAYWMILGDSYAMDTGPSVNCFRPIQTEEEKTVSEMVALRSVPKANIDAYTDFARDLYQAGYRNNQQLLSELYQVLGELGAPKNVLDQVDAAQMGEKLPHDTLLPFIGSDE